MVLILGSHVEIVRLDLDAGTSHLILHTLAPNTSHDNPYNHPKICGDLVSIGINNTDQVLLVKLSTAEAILFAPSPQDFALVRGHLVITTADAGFGSVRLDVVAEESLQSLWKPAVIASPAWRPDEWEGQDGITSQKEGVALGSTRGHLVSMKEVQSMVSETIDISETHSLRLHRLAVHECPMGDGDEYIIWVYCSSSSTESRCGEFSPDDGFRSSVYKYRLRLPSGRGGNRDQPSLQLLLVTGAQREWPVHVDVSYAGHTEIFEWARLQHGILALAELHLADQRDDLAKQDHRDDDDEATSIKTDNLERLELGGCGDYVHVSAYSGALTYSTYLEVVVDYFD